MSAMTFRVFSKHYRDAKAVIKTKDTPTSAGKNISHGTKKAAYRL